MKRLITKVIQLRNPKFEFGDSIDIGDLIGLSYGKAISFIRSLKLLIRFRFPGRLFLGRGVRFYGLRNIKWGTWVQVGDYSILSAYGKKSKLIVGNNVSLGGLSRFIVTSSFQDPGKHIVIGDNVGIGDYCHIGGGGGVEIGSNCIIGSYLSIHPSNHNFDDTNELIRLQGVNKKGVKIGNDCWIGAKVTILDGVVVGDHSVIGAGSLVTKSFPAYSIIGGVPAKVLKKRNIIE